MFKGVILKPNLDKLKPQYENLREKERQIHSRLEGFQILSSEEKKLRYLSGVDDLTSKKLIFYYELLMYKTPLQSLIIMDYIIQDYHLDFFITQSRLLSVEPDDGEYFIHVRDEIIDLKNKSHETEYLTFITTMITSFDSRASLCFSDADFLLKVNELLKVQGFIDGMPMGDYLKLKRFQLSKQNVVTSE